MRIFFFFVCLVFFWRALLSFFLIPDINILILRYTPSQITWFYIPVVINLIFGIFFLVFVFFLNKLILKIPKIITRFVWISIGLIVLELPLTIAKGIHVIQRFPFDADRLLIIMIIMIVTRIVFISLLWFLLGNVKQMALGLRETPNQ